LQNLKDKDKNNGGELTIGGLNQKYATLSDVNFEDSPSATQWLVPVKEISFGDAKMNLHEYVAEIATAENHMRILHGTTNINLCRGFRTY
jgi:hypothetical protein